MKRDTLAGVFLVSYFNVTVKHVLNTWFNFFDAKFETDMTEAFNESFTLEELEITKIEERASEREEETIAGVEVKASIVRVFVTMEILCA